jgi:phage terminase small subunit
MALSAKQQSFVEEYLRTWNATRAAIAAEYSERTAYSQGNRLLKDAEVQGEIKARLEARAMTSDEVLARFAEQARFDPTPYLLFDEITTEEGQVIAKIFLGMDLDKLRADGLGHLIKGIAKTRNGLKVEWVDSQKALELLGKHLGLFRDRIELSGPNGGPIEHTVQTKEQAAQELAEWRKQQQEALNNSNASLTGPILPTITES